MQEPDPNFIVPVQLPLNFWIALQMVRNHVYENGQQDFFKQALEKPSAGGFYDSINVVDFYLHQFHWWAYYESVK